MWKTLALSALICFIAVQLSAADDNREAGTKVQMTGTLHFNVLSIGGETTGATLKNKEGLFELKLSDEQKRTAGQLDGKRVVVAGTLVIRPGIEVKERKIITVDSLE